VKQSPEGFILRSHYRELTLNEEDVCRPNHTASRPIDPDVHLHRYDNLKSITKGKECRDIAQAAIDWLTTAAARVWVKARSCGICGGQSDTGGRFSPSTSVSLANHSTD
jgi:hypothetical protein